MDNPDLWSAEKGLLGPTPGGFPCSSVSKESACNSRDLQKKGSSWSTWKTQYLIKW